jgi:transcription elongation factor Elf1
MSQVELVGEDKQGMITHLNCEKGSGDSLAVVNEANVGFISCASCGLIYPDEVSQSFNPTEGYDPPSWKFDGLEWRMS